jgi:hypothetical protein
MDTAGKKKIINKKTILNITLSTESSALTPATLRLSVMSSSGFCTSLIALLLIGSAYLNNAPGSLIGGPDINTDRSGKAGLVAALAFADPSNAGTPVTNPTAKAIEIAHSFKENDLPFCEVKCLK